MAAAARPTVFIEGLVRILDADGELVFSCSRLWPVGTPIGEPLQRGLDWCCDSLWMEGDQYLLVEVFDIGGLRALDPNLVMTEPCVTRARLVRLPG